MSLLEDSSGLIMSLLEDSAGLIAVRTTDVLLKELEVDGVKVLIVTLLLFLCESTAGLPLVVVARGSAPAPDGDNSSSLCCL